MGNKKFSRIHKTWIEINRTAIVNNVRSFRSILKKKTALYAVVKSNAYGHGLELFAQEANRARVDGFCVDSVIEGVKLRSCGIEKPILVLGPTLPALFFNAWKHSLTISVSNLEAIRALRREKHIPAFHLKFDTGMHRQGFSPDEVNHVARRIKSSMALFSAARGVYTHFAAAKDIAYPTYTNEQFKKFKTIQEFLKAKGITKLIAHTAATGGATMFPHTHLNMVRIGIGLYGYWPSNEALVQHPLVLKKKLSLIPVLSWRALVSEVRVLREGEFIGYDLTEYALRDTNTLVIPIGYWHGYPRSLSSVGEVLVCGVRARVLGRVSMDLISVGLPKGVRAHVGDIATLIGKSGRESCDARFIAGRAGTVSYEFLTRLNPLIERYIVNRL